MITDALISPKHSREGAFCIFFARDFSRRAPRKSEYFTKKQSSRYHSRASSRALSGLSLHKGDQIATLNPSQIDLANATLAEPPREKLHDESLVVFDRSRSEPPFVLKIAGKGLGDDLHLRFCKAAQHEVDALLGSNSRKRWSVRASPCLTSPL